MELFTILFSFHGISYNGSVSFHLDEYNKPYYKVQLTANDIVTNIELIPVETGAETFWKDRSPDTDEPREILNNELMQAIGKEIEKHDALKSPS